MKYEELLESVSSLAKHLSHLHLEIADSLEPSVEHIITTRSRDIQSIEQTLDQLLDIACHDVGLKLFRNLCRYYWTINPEATTQYIHAYRELWDEEDID